MPVCLSNGKTHRLDLNSETSWTLAEQVRFDGPRVASTDWASYPILTFEHVPQLEVELSVVLPGFSRGRRGGAGSDGGGDRERRFRRERGPAAGAAVVAPEGACAIMDHLFEP